MMTMLFMSLFSHRGIIASTFAEDREMVFKDNKIFNEYHQTSDCPIRATLEPQKIERSGPPTPQISANLEPNRRWTYSFKPMSIRRIQLTFKEAPPGTNLYFRWTGDTKRWAPETFAMPLENGKTICYTTAENFPSNAKTRSLEVTADRAVRGLDLVFSDRAWDHKLKTCPGQAVFDNIERKFAKLRSAPTERMMAEFTSEIAKILKTYDCRQLDVPPPVVPAWQLCADEGEVYGRRCRPETWFEYVCASKLRAAKTFAAKNLNQSHSERCSSDYNRQQQEAERG